MTNINLKVLDISHHNVIEDDGFQQMYDSGIRGIIHKSSQGSDYTDPMYAQRRQQAVTAGLLWGAYHFGDNADVPSQIDRFLDAALPDDSTLVALDYEPHPKGKAHNMTLDQCREFLQTIEQRLGHKAVLYSGNLIKETLGVRSDVELGAHRLWLAQYGPIPMCPPAWRNTGAWLWQFSGDGVNSHGLKPPGISGLIDMNHFEGSDDELAAQWIGDTTGVA